MDNELKSKIRGLVEGYKKLFPEEYEAFLTYAQDVRNKQSNGWAETGGDHVFERKLGEIPATLDAMFTKYLSKDELERFKGNDDNGKKGWYWFYKTFKEFRITKEI